MSELAKLRHEYDQKVAQANALMEQHPGKMPTDIANRVDQMISEAERISGKIEHENELNQRAGDEHAATSLSGSGWKNSDGTPLKALHSAADIRSHYAAKNRIHGNGSAPFALDDFVRGVAGMNSKSAEYENPRAYATRAQAHAATANIARCCRNGLLNAAIKEPKAK